MVSFFSKRHRISQAKNPFLRALLFQKYSKDTRTPCSASGMKSTLDLKKHFQINFATCLLTIAAKSAMRTIISFILITVVAVAASQDPSQENLDVIRSITDGVAPSSPHSPPLRKLTFLPCFTFTHA